MSGLKGHRLILALRVSGVCDFICRDKLLHDCDVTESLMQTVFNYCNEDGWLSS